MSDLKLSLIVEAATKAAQAAIDDLSKSQRALGVAAQTGGQQAAAAIDQINASVQNALAAEKNLTTAQAALNAETRAFAAASAAAAAGARQHGKDAAGAAEATDRVGHSSAAVNRELLVLAHELSQGNYKRFGGSLLVLAEQTDALTKILSPAGLAVGSVIAVIALLAGAEIKALEADTAFANSIRLTGNYAGVTRGQFDQAARSIATSADVSIGSATETLQSLVASGRIAGPALVSVATAIESYAQASGQSAADVEKDFVKLFDEPIKGAIELNRQTHFLTLADYDRIKALQESGDVQGAAIETTRLLNAQLEDQKPKLGGLVGGWHALGLAISDAFHNLGERLDPTLDTKIATFKGYVEEASRAVDEAKRRGENPGYVRGLETFLDTQKQGLQGLLDQKSLEEEKAAAAEKKTLHDQEQVEAKQYVERVVDTYKTGGKALAQAIADFNRRADLLEGTKDALSASDRASAIAGLKKRFSPPTSSASPAALAGDRDRPLKASLDESLAELSAAVAARDTTEASALAQSRTRWSNYYQGVSTSLRLALASTTLSSDQRTKLNADLDAARSEAAAKDAELQAKQSTLTRKGEEDRAKLVAETSKAIGDARTAALEQLQVEYSARLGQLKNEGVSDAQAVADAWRAARQQAIDVDAIGAGVTAAQNRFRDQQVVIGARVTAGDITQSSARSQIADAAREEIGTLTAARQQILQLLQATPENPRLIQILEGVNGELAKIGEVVQSPFQKLATEWSDTTRAMQDAGVSAFGGIADRLTEVSIRGKADFKGLANSVISDIIRIQERALLAGLITKAIGLIGSLGSISSADVAGYGTSSGQFAGSDTFANGGPIPGYATGGGIRTFDGGGDVTGPGTGTSDSILSLLRPGSFVLNAKATANLKRRLVRVSNGERVFAPESVRALGLDFLRQINGSAASSSSRDIAELATGGLVGGSVPSLPAGGGFPNSQPISINNNYDFRGAGPDQLSQLYAYGEQIKRDTYQLVFDSMKRGYAPR